MRYFELFEAKEPPKGLAFYNECTDAHSGQTNFTLWAIVNGKKVGQIDYVKFRETVNISYISSIRMPRKGIATAMLKELQGLYPETEINWGGLTDDGSKLYAKTQFTTVVNPEVHAKIEQLNSIRAEMAEIEAKFNAWHELPEDQREQAREMLAPLTTRWNDLRDQEYDLEGELGDTKAAKKLITR
jgi:hypothetical protein